LHYAAREGHAAVVETLLAAKKVEVNAGNHWKDTPLHYAAEKGHEEIVRLLRAKNVEYVETPTILGPLAGFNCF
ncbi:MAG: ankyrin repeat domain-containing protein, partial [Holosporales bacterium]|nr:ankyrin repeat domain-containing protein [Holosporales bacterium]